MDNENLEKLFKLGLLYELIDKSKEIVQTENLCGGYRGYVDDLLATIGKEVYNQIEDVKNNIRE